MFGKMNLNMIASILKDLQNEKYLENLLAGSDTYLNASTRHG